VIDRSRGTADAVVARRRAERDSLIAVARGWAGRAGPALGAQAMVLVGSVARGDFNKWSDIDVVVVAENLPERLGDRLALLGPTHRPPGVEAILWTPAELAERCARGTDPIAIEAYEVGVVLHGSLPRGAAS